MYTDRGRIPDLERTSFALPLSGRTMRMASPQSEESRLGTGMSLIGTPSLLRFFSADIT